MSDDVSASQQIDAIIDAHNDWRGQKLAKLRAIIRSADPKLIEEIKWRKPSRPEGVPTWGYGGTICVADILKDAVRITFTKGAQLQDASGIFNTRLDSKTVRAIDFAQNNTPNASAIVQLVRQAIAHNTQGKES